MVSLTKKKVSARNRMVFNPFNLPRGCTRVKVCVQQYHAKNNQSSSNFKKEKKIIWKKVNLHLLTCCIFLFTTLFTLRANVFPLLNHGLILVLAYKEWLRTEPVF